MLHNQLAIRQRGAQTARRAEPQTEPPLDIHRQCADRFWRFSEPAQSLAVRACSEPGREGRKLGNRDGPQGAVGLCALAYSASLFPPARSNFCQPLGGLRMACMRFIEREENAS